MGPAVAPEAAPPGGDGAGAGGRVRLTESPLELYG